MSRLTEFKDAVRSRGGSIQDTGYVTHGDHKVAHVEAVRLSVNMCRTIEQELHYVEFIGVRHRHMEFEVEFGVER